MKTTLLRILFGALAAIPNLAYPVFYCMETLQHPDGHQVIFIHDMHQNESTEQEQAFIQSLKQALPEAIVYVEDPAQHSGTSDKIRRMLLNNYQAQEAIVKSYDVPNFNGFGIYGLTCRLRDNHIQGQSIECRFGHDLIEDNSITHEELLEDLLATIQTLRKNNATTQDSPSTQQLKIHTNRMLDALYERDQKFYTLDGPIKKMPTPENNIFDIAHSELIDLVALDNIQQAAAAQKTAIVIAGGAHCAGIAYALQKHAHYNHTHATGNNLDVLHDDSIYLKTDPEWFENCIYPDDCTPLSDEEIHTHLTAASKANVRTYVDLFKYYRDSFLAFIHTATHHFS